jgi:Glucodextranase, domain B/PASTA domain
MRARPLVVVSCLAAALVAEGCGGDEPRASPRLKAVTLQVSEPGDTAVVRGEVVDVRGSVEPAGAAVEVLGQDTQVSAGGSFTASVPLRAGANVIDVIATARGREPSMTALRVTREVPVEVPDLGGMNVEELQARLDQAGLEAEVEEAGGLIEDLLPGDPEVCEQRPDAGSEVRPGSTVRVFVSKSC